VACTANPVEDVKCGPGLISRFNTDPEMCSATGGAQLAGHSSVKITCRTWQSCMTYNTGGERQTADTHYDRQGNPIDMWKWVELHKDRTYVVVASDEFEWKGEDVYVSTVWLGINYNFIDAGPPIIFETMVFGGEYDEWQWRYETEAEARAGHVIITEGVIKVTENG
jgi:hypothetical protein